MREIPLITYKYILSKELRFYCRYYFVCLKTGKNLLRNQGDAMLEKNLLRNQGDAMLEKNLLRNQGDAMLENNLLRNQGDAMLEKNLLRNQGDAMFLDFRSYWPKLEKKIYINRGNRTSGKVAGFTCISQIFFFYVFTLYKNDLFDGTNLSA